MPADGRAMWQRDHKEVLITFSIARRNKTVTKAIRNLSNEIHINNKMMKVAGQEVYVKSSG